MNIRDITPLVLGCFALWLGSVVVMNFINGAKLLYLYIQWPVVLALMSWSAIAFESVVLALCIAPPIIMLAGSALLAERWIDYYYG